MHHHTTAVFVLSLPPFPSCWGGGQHPQPKCPDSHVPGQHRPQQRQVAGTPPPGPAPAPCSQNPTFRVQAGKPLLKCERDIEKGKAESHCHTFISRCPSCLNCPGNSIQRAVWLCRMTLSHNSGLSVSCRAPYTSSSALTLELSGLKSLPHPVQLSLIILRAQSSSCSQGPLEPPT